MYIGYGYRLSTCHVVQPTPFPSMLDPSYIHTLTRRKGTCERNGLEMEQKNAKELLIDMSAAHQTHLAQLGLLTVCRRDTRSAVCST